MIQERNNKGRKEKGTKGENYEKTRKGKGKEEEKNKLSEDDTYKKRNKQKT